MNDIKNFIDSDKKESEVESKQKIVNKFLHIHEKIIIKSLNLFFVLLIFVALFFSSFLLYSGELLFLELINLNMNFSDFVLIDVESYDHFIMIATICHVLNIVIKEFSIENSAIKYKMNIDVNIFMPTVQILGSVLIALFAISSYTMKFNYMLLSLYFIACYITYCIITLILEKLAFNNLSETGCKDIVELRNKSEKLKKELEINKITTKQIKNEILSDPAEMKNILKLHGEIIKGQVYCKNEEVKAVRFFIKELRDQDDKRLSNEAEIKDLEDIFKKTYKETYEETDVQKITTS